MVNIRLRETYKNVTSNSADILPTKYIVVEDIKNAEKQSNLPHNQLTIANQNTTCTIYIFLDNFIDSTKPDFVLFPSQQISFNYEEGYTFTTLFLKNTHAVDTISANEIKIRVSTIKEMVL